ncbi:MAG: hypothetical protein L3J13_07170 [Devosiaceae bacterium]|nr:hypothetical protein [Devosiaceae bacterium]
MQGLAIKKLDEMLERSNASLLKILDEMVFFKETHNGVSVNFEFLFRKSDSQNQYQATIFVWDDGPAMEEFPVMASSTIEFEPGYENSTRS